jgi:acyl-[acyl-carrier-protein] desaturase
MDYIDILDKLILKWDIGSMGGLNPEAEKARDYLMKLPSRMTRIAERMSIPENSYQFKWVEPAKL